MMNDMLALLYDVHGNGPALDAVLEDAAGRGADRHLLGGDYSAFGAWPVACVERLRALPGATWIRGNWERWQAEPDAVPDTPDLRAAGRWVAAQLGPALVAELAALPAVLSRDGTLFCHASPRSDIEAFLPEADADGGDDQLLAGVAERRVVFGHTHVQFRRTTPGGVELVNPGSVGLPWDGDQRAAYATLDDQGAVELHRVAYDVDAAVAALEALGEPWTASVIRRLRAARFDA
jgi:diadenosine tetraphosphatase ApaH/serine/threonine PP2A family protein phosphatase